MSRVRRVYRIYRAHKKSIGKIIGNPIVIGAVAGVLRNIAQGKQAVDIEKIKTQVTQPNLSNPLLILGAGLLLKNKALQAIGAFLIVDPLEETTKPIPSQEIFYENILPEPAVIVKTV